MAYKTSKCQQPATSPILLIFRQFHIHILKNRTMLFQATFMSTPEKIGVGLEKQAVIFISISPGDGQSGIPVLTSFPVQ